MMKKLVTLAVAVAALAIPTLLPAQDLGYDFGVAVSKGKVVPFIAKNYLFIEHEYYKDIPVINLAHRYTGGVMLGFSQAGGLDDQDSAVLGVFLRAEWDTSDRTFVSVGWGFMQPWSRVVNGLTWDDIKRDSSLVLSGGVRF